MKKLTKEEMIQIIGGEHAPVFSICGVICPDGKTHNVNCGVGVNCVSDSSTLTVWCDDDEICPCDAPPSNF
ncbi:MAG: bacteriocin [Chitinophagaceae bacterium]|nr:bacteriocin [Chitinophagaceae bacterium]